MDSSGFISGLMIINCFILLFDLVLKVNFIVKYRCCLLRMSGLFVVLNFRKILIVLLDLELGRFWIVLKGIVRVVGFVGVMIGIRDKVRLFLYFIKLLFRIGDRVLIIFVECLCWDLFKINKYWRLNI